MNILRERNFYNAGFDGMGLDYRKEIERLFDLEYGHWIDAAFRFGLIFLGSVTLYLYLGDQRTLYWMVGQMAGHALHFSYLRSRGETCTRADVLIGGATFWALVAAFIWLPAWMIVQEDHALRIGGAAGIGAMLVFLIHRADRMLLVMLGEIAVIGVAIIWILVQTLAKVDHPGAEIGVTLSGGGLWVYFAITMFTNRRIRLTAERAAERSVQAQKMEAIGQLAGGVAHDFNNILTAVIGNLDLYEDLESEEKRAAAVRDARMAAERAGEVVQQLLAYARRSPMHVARRDVGALLEQVEALTRRLLPAAIDQSFEAPSEPLWVALDESQFLTALVNLVVNARDAMPEGGSLRVTARPTYLVTDDPQPDGTILPAGDYCEVTVCDTGHGIPPDILRRVTEPFFTTKAVGQGSGLGLSMVEGFARQSGGTLMIESSATGTAMHLLMPIAAAEGTLGNAPHSQHMPPPAMPQPAAQLRRASGEEDLSHPGAATVMRGLRLSA